MESGAEWQGQPCSGEMAAAANNGANIEHESHAEVLCDVKDAGIARKMKFNVKVIVANEIATMVQEALNEVVPKRFNKRAR